MNNSDLTNVVSELTKVLELRYEKANSIKREGNQIVIPDFMSLPEASEAILDYQRQMEDDTNKVIELNGHTNDTLHAFHTAMVTTFGNLVGTSSWSNSFFGPMKTPGKSRTIEIGPDETLTVPFGKVKVPGLPITMEIYANEEDRDRMKHILFINFNYKRKFEPLVEMIEGESRKMLENQSIFLHKAIDSKFNFLRLDGIDDDRVIYTAEQRKQVESNLFSLIVNTAEVKRRGASLKRAVLLYGTYGTSKTLTALLAAVKCTQNNWTFLNVLPGDDIVQAFEFAKRFQPAMVFFEDIDQVASGTRDEAINRILNTCDGILSKSAEVVTVMTTNNAEKIQKGMIRPGRIDVTLELGALDADAMVRMVRLYCPDIDGTLDGHALAEAGEGYPPAFVTEACQRALLYSINEGRDTINQEDIVHALRGLRSHYALMREPDWSPAESVDGRLRDLVQPIVESEAQKLGVALGRSLGREVEFNSK